MIDIKKIYFPGNQYVAHETSKDIFVIHHSAGWDDARGMYNNWANDSKGRVATAYGITNNGDVIQGFDPKFWAYALYINEYRNMIPEKYKTSNHDVYLNSRAIQVEICNWGALEKVNSRYFAWPASETGNYSEKYEVPKEDVIFYEQPFKGFHYYERYTDEEIYSLQELIKYHNTKDGIILNYNENMWNANPIALDGAPGIWTHVSYRTNKSDAHPQPELINMLKGL